VSNMGPYQKPRRKMHDRYVRWRGNRRRKLRLRYPSPAEVRFVRIMGGWSLPVPFIRSIRTGFPLTWLWMGRVLKSELIEREVRIGPFFADFATPNAAYHKVIEIDGQAFHTSRMDVVRDQEREDYLRERGWQIYRIKAKRLWREPVRVRADVLRFLRS